MSVIGCRIFDIILLMIQMGRKLGSPVADESENTTHSISKKNDYQYKILCAISTQHTSNKMQ